jgi:hypothetical protein
MGKNVLKYKATADVQSTVERVISLGFYPTTGRATVHVYKRRLHYHINDTMGF